MAEEDCVTTTICPNSRRKGEPKLGTHQKSYLVRFNGKITCAQEINGEPCPVKAFICKKDKISCTVCGVAIELGVVLCLHSAFYMKRGSPQTPQKAPHGKYCCATRDCFLSEPMTLKAKFKSNCAKCRGIIPIGSPIREVGRYIEATSRVGVN